ncbi:SPFH domain-containing protein [Streptosporangium sp. NPDC048865]|uniref:SPFH domain-containing protein n=1 Tax=Streptosporangium sp. NPDC048865 TaxID=3155766 RepID=UPI0034294FB0
MEILLVFLVLLGAGGYLWWAGRVVVEPDHVGLVRRRIGRRDRDHPRITPYDMRGPQARTLPPDSPSWLLPWIYTVESVPWTHVPANMIGLVEAKAGAKRPRERRLGRRVECDNFQDGQAFLRDGGEQGPQVDVLTGGQSYYINTNLFTVTLAPCTYVPPGTVGLVMANAGRVRPPDQSFGRHVDCDNFQDGQAFLDGQGEQGRQLAILPGGTYYDINPGLFQVITVDNHESSRDGLTPGHLSEIAIPVGYTGVVVTLEGAAPVRRGEDAVGQRVAGHDGFRRPWVFLARGGTFGVQEETLGEGMRCALNPWFVRVVLIPTRELILEWKTKSDSEARNFDAELEQITVTIQGHRVRVKLSQTLRIPEEAAPRLVSASGGTDHSGLGGLVHDPVPVQRFVEKVLGSAVVSYFSGMAAASNVGEFMQKWAKARVELASQVRRALEARGVVAIATNLESFEADDPVLNEELQRQAALDLRVERLDTERMIVRAEDEMDEVRVNSERRRVVLELEAEIGILGRENVAMIRMIREIAKMPVPDYIGGDVGSYVEALPIHTVQNLIGRLRTLRDNGYEVTAERPRELVAESASEAERVKPDSPAG